MIGRSPHEREAQRPIHTAIKSDHLEWNESLVMIHRDHHIIFAAICLIEQRIRADRANDIQTLVLRCTYSRPNDTDFLITHLPALSRMRVEAADAYLGS